jgi:hypothetical protein
MQILQSPAGSGLCNYFHVPYIGLEHLLKKANSQGLTIILNPKFPAFKTKFTNILKHVPQA